MTGGPLERLTAGLSGLAVAVGVLGGGLAVTSFVYPVGDRVALASTPGAPIRLRVPSQHIDAPIEQIQPVDGVLDPPRDYRTVGWWDASARPGADSGQTVITGHTVHTGGGVLDDLGRLHAGQKVSVVTTTGTKRYRVLGTTTWSKDELASRATELFGQGHGDGRLILITCTGWTGSYYTSNVIVVGQLIPRYAAST